MVRWVLATLSARDPATVLIDDALAVFSKKFALLRGQQVDHELRRSAEPYPFWRHHDRPVEENGMRLDCVEQGVLGEVVSVEPQFAKNRFPFAQQGTQRHARARESRCKHWKPFQKRRRRIARPNAVFSDRLCSVISTASANGA